MANVNSVVDNNMRKGPIVGEHNLNINFSEIVQTYPNYFKVVQISWKLYKFYKTGP